jgi:hypothetical protein
MPIIQSIKLQGVLQPQALRIRSQGQGLPEKKETQAKRKKGSRIAFVIKKSIEGAGRRPFYCLNVECSPSRLLPTFIA